MSYLKKFSARKILSLALVVALSVTAITIPTGEKAEGKTSVTVYDEINKPNISKEELADISESALVNGEETAEKINQYTDEADYEAAVNYALTAYYEDENFEELKDFVTAIDNRALDIVEGYKEAAKERAIGVFGGYEPGEVLLSFDKDCTEEEIKAMVEAEYGKCQEITKCFNGEYIALVSISLGQTVDMAVDAYSDYSITEAAASNDIAEIADSASNYVNDPLAKYEYHLDNINVKGAWDYLSMVKHEKVLVAVIDSGIQIDHPDLVNVLSPNSADVTLSSTPVLLSQCTKTYNSTHGTRVAGVIAAEANNGNQVAGVASCYDNDVVEILGVQATTYYEEYDDYKFNSNNVIKAINYCAEQGVKVINYSAGSLRSNCVYQYLLEDINEAGIIFVCSAGNDSSSASYYPGDSEDTLSVMATDENNNLASFTNYGTKKDICAPGVGIYTTSTGGLTACPNGTSFSSPIAAAVVGMMCALNKNLTLQDVREILADTSIDIGIGDKCRSGLINAEAAVKMVGGYTEETTLPSTDLLEVIGAVVSSPADNTVGVVWGQDSERIEKGYTYNVYVNGVKYLNQVACNYYTISNITAGEAKVKITAVLNGAETAGVTLKVNVTGAATEVVTTTQAPTTTEAITTTKEATTEVATTTVAETTTAGGVKPLEVIGAVVSNPSDNTVGIVWGQDSARIESGCTYNVYINGIKYLSEVGCNYYTVGNINAGNAIVKITAVLNGVESDGVTLNVIVSGVTISPTTTQAPTTAEVITTEAVTTEVITTETPTVEETTTSNIVLNTNIAVNKTAYSSSNENDTVLADKAFDGDMSTRWSSAWADNQWIYIDLGENYNVAQVKVFWEAAFATQFKIQVSTDANNWQDVATLGDTYCKDYDVEFTPVNARYVRVFGVTRGTEYGFSIYEIEVYATENTSQPEVSVISQGKNVVSSSDETTELVAQNIADGDINTRWSSAWTDSEWVYIDLGENKFVSYVEFDWEAAYATAYQVQISQDGTNWTTVNNVTNGQGGKETTDINQNARYVKMQGVTRSTQYGYSLYEMSVYGY